MKNLNWGLVVVAILAIVVAIMTYNYFKKKNATTLTPTV